MFRLSKLTDYGIVLLAQLARDADTRSSSADGDVAGVDGSAAYADEASSQAFVQLQPLPRNSRELAAATDLPAPAVSKVLKLLARQGLIDSQRGAKGGYTLARRPEDISVAEMIYALEGPVAITECTGVQRCEHEGSCHVRGPWQVINAVVRDSLSTISLADVIDARFTSSGGPLGRSHGLQIQRQPPAPRTRVTSDASERK